MERNKTRKAYYKMSIMRESYTVNSEDGTVNCTQQWKLKLPKVYQIMCKELGIPLTFKTVGVARLAPTDTFDESIGRHLAQSKSHVKAYRKYSQLIAKLNKKIYQDINVFDETFSFATTLFDREEAHVKELKKL